MSDLSPQPDPEIEPREPRPGGPDAVPDNGHRIVPNLTPDENPAIEDKLPDSLREEMASLEDTSTEATESPEGADEDPKKESPA